MSESKKIKIRDRIARRGTEALSILGLIIIWQIAALAIDDKLLLPSFFQVIEALSRDWQTILERDLPTSLIHFLIGMGGGLLVALPLGMSMGWFRWADRVLDPIVEIFRPIPPWPGFPFPSSGSASQMKRLVLSSLWELSFPS